MDTPIGTIDLHLGRTVELDEFQRFPQIGEGQNADDTYLDILSRAGLVDRRHLDAAEEALYAAECRLANGEYESREASEQLVALKRANFEKIKARILEQLPEVRRLRKFGASVAALQVPDCQATGCAQFAREVRAILQTTAKNLLGARAR